MDLEESGESKAYFICEPYLYPDRYLLTLPSLPISSVDGFRDYILFLSLSQHV